MLNHYRLFGIDRYEDIIEDIIRRHELKKQLLAVQVMLTEGISNAFKHGNSSDPEKTIDITVSTEAVEGERRLHIHISDEGTGINHPWIPYEEKEDILEERGRGLFLISQFADTVNIKGNQIHIYKRLQEERV